MSAPFPVPELPRKARGWLYWIGYVVGVLSAGVTAVSAAVALAVPEAGVPVWVPISSAVLQFVTAQLNALAGRHLEPDPPGPLA